MPVPVQAKVKTDARISFLSRAPTIISLLPTALVVVVMMILVMIMVMIMMTICHRLTYSCNEESRTLGQISEAVTSHHRLWPLKISFIYLCERVGQRESSKPTARACSNSKGCVTKTVSKQYISFQKPSAV